MSYAWLKALHVISFVAWFAGLFYIFRLYVYHVENRDKPDVVSVLEVMERRLHKIICIPAMIATTVFGGLLLHQNPDYLQTSWFHLKAGALFFLFGYQFLAGKVRRDFARGDIRLTSKQCRMINEVPTLLLIVIVTAVVVKPVLW